MALKRTKDCVLPTERYSFPPNSSQILPLKRIDEAVVEGDLYHLLTFDCICDDDIPVGEFSRRVDFTELDWVYSAQCEGYIANLFHGLDTVSPNVEVYDSNNTKITIDKMIVDGDIVQLVVPEMDGGSDQLTFTGYATIVKVG